MLKKQIQTLEYFLGFTLIIIGILTSLIWKNKYFYVIFSLGLLIVTWKTYNKLSKKRFFKNFKTKHQIFFWTLLIITSIIADYLGTLLDYWQGAFFSNFELTIKYILQWAIPFTAIMFFILIGQKMLEKQFSKITSFILAIIIFGTTIGFIMEYLNQFAHSWTILKMPIINQKIGNFFLFFQTIGYWIMGTIPYTIYLITKKIFKIKQ